VYIDREENILNIFPLNVFVSYNSIIMVRLLYQDYYTSKIVGAKLYSISK